MKSIKFFRLAMVATTAIWLASMPILGTIGFMATRNRSGIRHVFGDQYFDIDRGVSLSGSQLFAESMETAISIGLILPMILYVIAMVALSVLHFATER